VWRCLHKDFEGYRGDYVYLGYFGNMLFRLIRVILLIRNVGIARVTVVARWYSGFSHGH
jgi:hypothetical protein